MIGTINDRFIEIQNNLNKIMLTTDFSNNKQLKEIALKKICEMEYITNLEHKRLIDEIDMTNQLLNILKKLREKYVN